MSLEVVPMTLRAANAFVEHHHRHHRPDRGCIFTLGCERDGELVGVAIIGRPKARGLGLDHRTAEVTRLCTLDSERSRHAASKLYAAAWRACRAMGYHRLVTYTLASESGVSLRAAGFAVVAEVKGREWSAPSRPRRARDGQEAADKRRWEVALA